jgi:alpha-glucosidase
MARHLLAQPSHDGSPLYVDNQAPDLGDTVSLSVRVPDAAGVTGLHVRTTPDGEHQFIEATVDRRHGGETWWRVDVEVRNPVAGYRFLLDGPSGTRWLSAAGVASHDVPDATDFRLLAGEPPPDWAADAVVYQIFPDRFARSAAAAGRVLPDWAIPCDWDTPVIGRGPEAQHQFYGGDLDGVAAHLDHIEALGANTVYLTPIFPARSNHRYDGAAFDRVDPLLGGDEALVRLGEALRARGMRLLGDLTTNHCGDTHPWFRDAAPGDDAFYWEGDSYESWLGVKSLPKLNWGSATTRSRFLDGPDSVAQRWLDAPFRFDGWRVDVANMTGRRGADSYTHDVARLIRGAIAGRDALLVAEHFHDASGDLDRGGWHGTMNYSGFLRPLWSWMRHDSLNLPDFLGVPGGVPRRDGMATHATMRAFAAMVSWRSFTSSWTLLGSHDTARIRTVVGDPAAGEVALGLQVTYPGTPMVFAGDELGLTGVNGEDSRRPMPWGSPTLGYYRDLLALRRASEALRRGGLRWAHVDADCLAYLRESPDERLLVFARRAAGAPTTVEGLDARTAMNVYGGAEITPTPGGGAVLPGDGPTFQVWRL